MSTFPQVRLRRLRRTESLRRMFDMPMPGPEKFIWPIFIMKGSGSRQPIDSMPGQYRYSVDVLLRELESIADQGIGGILIFGLPDESEKDATGTVAFAENGVVQDAVQAIKREFPDVVIITDICLCAYTNHGHCGLLTQDRSVDNDATNAILGKVAVSHAAAGADVVAPSAMMDGQVAAIRAVLDNSGFQQTLIMSYSTKFASAMYGPFRDAEKSSPQNGDRKGYQASYGDLKRALRESLMDEQEGADILMVKPALFYLDVIAKLRERTDLPIAVYNVSGEYSMLNAMADRGWGDLRDMVRESTTALVRTGADLIISYWANRYDAFFGEKQ